MLAIGEKQTEEKKEKFEFIDILKSFACLCVVIGHVIRGLRKGPIEVSLFLKDVADFVYLFHVPCFFFASGYLYVHSRPKKGKGYLKFVWKKLVVLGLPYFACSVFYMLAGPIMSADIETYSFLGIMKELLTAPIAQYWYLYALFEMFLIVPVVQLAEERGVNSGWILLLFIACALGIRVDILWAKYLILYTCYFYLGVYFNQRNFLEKYCAGQTGKRGLFVCGAATIGIYVLYRAINSSELLGDTSMNLLQGVTKLLLVICMVGMSVAVTSKKNTMNRFLIWLSEYLLYIYLLHTWFTGSIRVILCRVGISSCWLHTICGMAVGVAGPVIAACIIRRVPVFRFWFEPLRVFGSTYGASQYK